MWNSKRIEKLEDRMEIFEWKQSNPPKYNVGDKPKKNVIVTEVKFKNLKSSHLGINMMFWDYICIDINTGKQVSI